MIVNDSITQHTIMKKLLITTLFVICLAGATMAQRGFHIGFTSIYNFSYILNQNNYETLDQVPVISKSELAYNLKFGYNLGLSTGYNFNRKYGIQAEILYNLAGQNYEDTFQPGSPYPNPYHVVREVNLRYLQIPLFFKYKFDAGQNFRMYTLVGPTIGFLLSAEETVIINDEERTDLSDPYDKFNHFDWGVSLGAGTEYFFTKYLYLNVGFRTYFGIADMNGPKIKDLEWFSKNDVSYAPSHNFRVGLNVGLHLLISPDNPFGKKTEPIEPMQTN